MVWTPSVLSSRLDLGSLLTCSAIFPWTSCSCEMAWTVLPPPTSASRCYGSLTHWNICCIERLCWYWYHCNGQALQHQSHEYSVNILTTDHQSINETNQVQPQKTFLRRSQCFIRMTETSENTTMWKTLLSSGGRCRAKRPIRAAPAPQVEFLYVQALTCLAKYF